jgi:thiol-disulfide isomerase/thioredoxin
MWGKDLNGTSVVVDYSKAQVTLLNFWATWCGPCRDEMPMLQQMHESFKDQGLQVFAVTFEETDNAEIATFLADMDLTFTVMKPRSQCRPNWVGVEGILPNSYLIDSEGRVLRRYVGASPEQIVGMQNDLAAVIEGRRMGMLVIPETPTFTTADEHQKKLMDAQRAEHNEQQRKKR